MWCVRACVCVCVQAGPSLGGRSVWSGVEKENVHRVGWPAVVCCERCWRGREEGKAKGGDQNMIIVPTSKLPTTMHPFQGRLKHHQKKKRQHGQQQHSIHAPRSNWKYLPHILQLTSSSSSYRQHTAQTVLNSRSNHNLPKLNSKKTSVSCLCSAESFSCRPLLHYWQRTDVKQSAAQRIITLTK